MATGSTTCRQYWTPFFGEEIGARGGYGEITGDLARNAHQEFAEILPAQEADEDRGAFSSPSTRLRDI